MTVNIYHPFAVFLELDGRWNYDTDDPVLIRMPIELLHFTLDMATQLEPLLNHQMLNYLITVTDYEVSIARLENDRPHRLLTDENNRLYVRAIDLKDEFAYDGDYAAEEDGYPMSIMMLKDVSIPGSEFYRSAICPYYVLRGGELFIGFAEKDIIAGKDNFGLNALLFKRSDLESIYRIAETMLHGIHTTKPSVENEPIRGGISTT